MACFLQNKNNMEITIPQVNEIGKITFYTTLIKVGNVSWTVDHRYSDFASLHDNLVVDHCVTKDILPPKKLIGKRDPAFVEKRRQGLEIYLSSVVIFLKETMPKLLAVFLDFQKYDILFLLQEMSSLFLKEGDLILSSSKNFKFNPLQMHAISERLKQPCPPAEIFDRRCDFSHVLDFCSQLQTVEVEGSWSEVGTSNIVPNNCAFELSVFKNVHEFIVTKASVERIYGLGTVKQTLRTLRVYQCNLQSPLDLLLCDAVHKECGEEVGEDKQWVALEEADFSQNQITSFANTLKLMPNLKRLTANENRLVQVDDFSSLPQLSHLYLSANRISELGSLGALLGNIIHLDLSQNRISSLEAFSTLMSLQGLDLGSNAITDVSQVQHIQALDKLDYLVLTGNPVATIVDYRIKVLQHFGRRAACVCLDNEKPSQKELDTVAVVLALQVVKEGKTPVFSRTIEPTFPNSPQ